MPTYPKRAIYLAGPEVFLPPSMRDTITAEKQTVLADMGFTGLDPMDNELALPDDSDPMTTARAIYQANIDLLRRCDGALVNLTPFRGPSADAGTVFETGYLAALGTPMVGYTLYGGDYETRVPQPDTSGIDASGRTVEQFRQVDNLMIESAFLSLGGKVVRGRYSTWDQPDVFDAKVFREAAEALAERLECGPGR